MRIFTKCGAEKTDEDFAWRVKSSGTRQSHCRDCRRSYDVASYKDQPRRRAVVMAANAKQVARKQAYVRAALEGGCVDCGLDDMRTLEFDHLDGVEKVAGVMSLARSGASITRIQAEIDKCEVVCRNCHAIRTHERAGWEWAIPAGATT
jgi:hypothetical protein